MKFIFILSVIFVTKSAHSVSPRIDPLVRITQGLVRGQKASDGDYSYFLGIPYAQVDLDNPFGPALPAPKFEEEIFNAYEGTIKCPQPNILNFSPTTTASQETLDCLILNIYVPNEASSKNPLPVLVWIHGGAFAFGYAGEYHPRDLVRHGIIVVTINYRLGPYGFMCLDVPTVPGNQGLKDQYEALRWIRSNIGSFGGNPYNVTISGQSAGSCSALLHLYSYKTKLFNKVIAESGTPQSEGMFVNGDVDAAKKIAQHLGYNTANTEQALDFLAKTSPDLVVEACKDINIILRPCKEKSFSGIDNFVESDPFMLSNDKKISNTPILIGHTSKEQVNSLAMIGDDYFKSDPFYEKINNNFNLNEEKLLEIASIVRHFYIGDSPISKELTSELEEFESDFIFNHPVERTIANLLKENANPIYEYLFSYLENTEATSAGHAAELKYLFNFNNLSTAQTQENKLIIDRITALWTNFVKYGNPTPEETELLPIAWAPSTFDNRPYMVIDTEMRVEHRVYKDRMSFWDLFYSIYEKNHNLARQCSF